MHAIAVPSQQSKGLSPERLLVWTFAVTGVVKLILGIVLPFTGDEAYFVVWARHLDYGYYDHGPVTGWMLWLPLLLGHSVWLVRLPAVLISQAVGLVFWRALQPVNRETAAWVAILYLVSPMSFMTGILVTTDTPLLFFSVLSAAAAMRAHRDDRTGDYLWCGLWLGLAFLSKYFAVLLGFALAVCWLGFFGRPRIRGLLLVLLGVLPSAAVNILWNYHHSWANVLFNAFTRQAASGFTLVEPALYLFTTGYLITPMIAWAMLRRRHAARRSWREAWTTMRGSGVDLFLFALGVPLAVFLLVSFAHRIGVHWLFSFVPFLFPVLGVCLTRDGLRRLVRPLAIFTGAHLLALLVIGLLPVELARSHDSYFKIMLSCHPNEVIAKLNSYRNDHHLATPSYSKSALFEFYLQEDIPVMGSHSYHGRQDDFVTDFRDFEGEDFAIVSDRTRDLTTAPSWFDASEVQELEVRGAKFFVLLGRGFRYASYRESELKSAKRFYDLPPILQWLPYECPFCEKYDLSHVPARS